MKPAMATVVVALCLFAATSAWAQQTTAPSAPGETPSVDIPRVATPPRIDDYLPGGTHPGAAVDAFRQREPKDLAPATESTVAYLSYDDDAIYAAFVCRMSDPAKIRAHMAKRESVFNDDFVALMLDTFADKQRAYMFFVTPLGIQADGVTAAATGDDMSFDTEWRSAGRMTSDGYVVWMAIPFRSLRFPRAAGGPAHWGVALMRAIPAKDENDFWPGITRRINNFIAQFADLDGPSGVSPGRNVQLIPYGTFAQARVLDPDAAAYTAQHDTRGGLDAKAVAHDALTFDLTLNPDFSQVESDDPQVTANQRFEVFFPEKRPFFLENADVFNDTPQTLFFSRRIGDPQFGARMTGKLGHWALGAIVTDDRAPGEDASSTDPGSRAANTVLRLRDDLGESRVGVFVTSHRFGGAANDVYSFDARVKLNDRWVTDVQAVGDRDTAADGTKSSGSSLFADLSMSGRRFSDQAVYVDASPNFTTALGFVPRVDYRQASNYAQWRWFPAHGPVIDFGPNSFFQATWNYAGTLDDWIARVPFNVDLKGQTNIFGRHAFIQETVNGVRLREREDIVQFSTGYWKWLTFGTSFGHGTRPDYSPATGVLPFLGTFTDIAANVTFRPTSACEVDETYLYSRLLTRPGTPSALGGRIFTNPLLRSRINYQFSREWSLRAILDYDALTPDTTLIALDRTRHVGVDLLLTWLLHPGTALYVGYTDSYDNERLDRLDGVVPTTGALASTGRQLFVKTSWLVRF